MSKINRWIIILLLLLMAAGTVLEMNKGAAFVQSHLYQTPWFMALWLALAITAAVVLFRAKVYRRWPTLGIYISFALIILGMTVTTFTAKSGNMTLRKGERSSTFVSEDHPSKSWKTPFQVELVNFEVVFYPGSQAPQDFQSVVRFHQGTTVSNNVLISMNNIGRYKNYRFYQADYDAEGNVVLTVTSDPWGIGLNYAGYALLLLSFVCFFFEKKGPFRRLLSEISHQRAVTTVGLLLFLVAFTTTASAQPRTLPKESADKFGQMYVMYKNRVCPVQTLAKDFTTKLYGAPTYKGLTPEQVLSGWVFYFSEWCQEPMIKVKGDAVRQAMALSGKYARLVDFMDGEGNYRLENGMNLPMDDPNRAKFRGAYEKFNLVKMLYNGQLLKLFPIKDSVGEIQWFSQSDPLPEHVLGQEYLFIRQYLNYGGELAQTGNYAAFDTLMLKTLIYQKKHLGELAPKAYKIAAERFGNRYGVGRPMAMGSVLLGLLFFAYAMVCLAGSKSIHRGVRVAGRVAMGLLALYLLALFITRWVAAGHVPMSNSYETMLFMALCVTVIALIFGRRQPFALPFGLMMAGFAILVAMMRGANPSITLLMPVLASPLLCLHVAVIMLSYAILAFVMLNGLAALFLSLYWKLRQRPQQEEVLLRLSRIGNVLLYPAVFLLAIGIFVGAVWANVSWGTYWTWDPKEVWALITMMVYAYPLHRQIIQRPDWRPLRFHVFAVLAFLCVIITYFGVNLLLGGMHSYA